MKITSQLPSLVFVSLTIWATCGVSADRSFSRPVYLTTNASQRESSKPKGFPKESPTPLPAEWHGLLPLQSTRADVERVLGKPRKTLDSTYVYVTDADRIDVLYSAGPCEASGVERWKVPKDVIIRIDVRPKRTLRVKDLGLDKKRYIRARESHPNNWFSYWNKEDGIRIETIRSGKVEEVNSITYGPKANSQFLRCP